MGRPNVGKSTLINALMRQKIAAVSPRPQTTRRKQLGILTLENAQVIFIDTPGLHVPRHKLGEAMNEAAREALQESDLILFLVDVSQDPQEEDRLLANLLLEMGTRTPVILALNKVDLAVAEDLPDRQGFFMALMKRGDARDENVIPVTISATTGKNLDKLVKEIIERLAQGPSLYPEGQVTDLYERDIAADLIREAALIHLRDEVPHGITVRVDEFTEREDHGAFIAATIFVERESHKGIVIGQGGMMLKKIGTAARKEIEGMSERKVFLNLRVKVRKNWRDDEKFLRSSGYTGKI